jgi:CRP-like cAMP-binding protein
LAHWLLMAHDRIPFDEVRVTQEFISSLLGVRRERLTEAASALQKRNLIRYSRGHIQILDRVGLEAASCTCYWITKGCGGFLPSI